ncbi:thioesterase II family protein [Nocardia donostiensis]|uniref:Thioesterase TesA n=1 Tax=Nocardia donostiensis TaxID=1538463 RepID=A0A1W0B4D0_9NOCA|nr:alpha/beta fold hydrolase [Nocardia donostiensis]ONM50495.1 thioesterase [Nocardia donostiensis]OQS17268.1 thioesterase [Nocardia donostiensis]OQS18849.1 thioesterase [Nocardia donostiensis]
MPRELGWIRQFQAPRSAGSPPLLIFPHAGAGASAYRVFAKQLSQAFDANVFQYPGRQDRVREAAAETLPDIAAGAFEAFADSPLNRDQPITVFGHSMGSIIAFEFTRLAEAAGIPVRLLAVSSAAAPVRIAELPGHPTEDEELLEHMAALNGTGTDVMSSREVLKMALPVMKADYRAFDAYSCPPDVRVDASILVLGGDDDPFVAPRDLYAWDAHANSGVEVTVFSGGHFYLNDHIDGIAELLVPQPKPVG